MSKENDFFDEEGTSFQRWLKVGLLQNGYEIFWKLDDYYLTGVWAIKRQSRYLIKATEIEMIEIKEMFPHKFGEQKKIVSYGNSLNEPS